MKMLNPLARRPRTGYREAIDRIKRVARTSLALPEDAGVSVSELSCREPGCPDTETVVAILRAGEAPQVYRFHKPIVEVEDSDLLEAFASSG